MLGLPMIETRFLQGLASFVLRSNRLLSAVAFFLVPLGVLSGNATGQGLETNTEINESLTRSTISLKGIVTAQQKYSFTVSSDGKEYKVKLAENASVGLLMNRPYFDWKAEKVFVQPIDPKAVPGGDDDQDATDADKGNRIGYSLPATQLYLIAKFRNPSQMERVLKAKEIRLNLYLLSPSDLGRHEPTEDELYLAGKVVTGKPGGLVTIETDGKKYRARLGFRAATMNGFSVADLKPDQTQVSLTGVVDLETGWVTATNLAFQPIEKK